LVANGEPRILEYRGRGSLAGWIQLVAIREVLMLQRKTRRDRPGEDPRLLVVDSDPALALTKPADRSEFATAFRDALAALPPRSLLAEASFRRCSRHRSAGRDVLGPSRHDVPLVVGRTRTFPRRDPRSLDREDRLAADEVDSLIRAVASSFDIGW
jgi:hypothetical protein